MKNQTKQHILFTIEMLTPVGVSTLFFGTFAIIFGKFILGVALILYSSLSYTINWNHDNIKDLINKKLKRKNE